MKFDLPKDQTSIIKVIGVGGGGGNAVNHMYQQGIKGVDFVICNTDQQALDLSPIPTKIQFGASLTEGRGAGSLPEVGKNAAIENIDEIRDILEKNTKMVFITAGMGGGTGTGGAPVIAKIAKEMGILTVGIVTVPFMFEGKKRRHQAEIGIEDLRENVDTLLIICNDRLREMYGNLNLSEAFAQADDVLATAAKGIAEIITVTGAINVDFEDVRTVMTDSGVAIMGSATSEGEERSIKAVQQALASPLLNDNNIEGARYVLLNITYGSQEIQMDEVTEITDYIQEEAGSTADVIWGHGLDESLGEKISVTIIATGFNHNLDTGHEIARTPKKKVVNLEDEVPTNLTKPLDEKKEEDSIENNNEANEEAPFLKSQNEEDETSSDEAPESNKEEKHEIPVFDFTKQRTIEFDLSSKSIPEPKKEPEKKSEDNVFEPFLKKEEKAKEMDWNKSTAESRLENDISQGASRLNRDEPASADEQQRKANERISRLKELSMKLRAPSGLSDLENEPAFKRRNVDLDDMAHSSESEVSKFTLTEEEDPNGEKKIGLKDNNSFLHDNVD
ncbi:MAG: cell division protein FtsZ [Flavobacteriales bacterium]|nr:cell division protein FtsZ [Bacteroidales bacterium AH-315-I05]PCJ89023.1 MAG: cell division protein FtsZ [Flavobacteriales bacterium]